MSAQNPDPEGETSKAASRDGAYWKEDMEKVQPFEKAEPSYSSKAPDVETAIEEDGLRRERLSLAKRLATYLTRFYSSLRDVLSVVFGNPGVYSVLAALLKRPATYFVQIGSMLGYVTPVVVGGLAAVALSALVAFGISNWFGDIQIEVPDISTTLGGRPSHVTTMAWTNADGGPLAVGTADGFLVNIRRDGTLIPPPGDSPQRYASGPIVEIFPSETDVTSEAVWGSITGGYAGYRLRTEAAYRGLTFRLRGSLRPVQLAMDKLSEDISYVDLFRAGARIQGAQPEAVVAFDAPFRSAQLTAIKSFLIGTEPYVVTGYDSGVVLAFRAGAGAQVGPMQPESKAPFTTLHAGPILSIAGQAFRGGTSMLFATAAADGTVVLHRLRADPPAANAQAVSFEMEAGDPRSVLYGPVPRRDGLMMDRAGRVLLLWDQGGGVSVARLGGNEEPLFLRYPLTGIPQSIPRRSILDAQTALRDLGFYDGNLDGVVGAETLAAFSAFQARAGLSWIPPDDTRRLLPFLLPSFWATSAVALSPRGDLFAFAGADGVVRIVLLPTDPRAASSTATTMALLGHRAMVTRIVISPDGRMLASLDTAGRLLMTDLDRVLGISSLPLAAFSTAPVPEALDPLPVDLTEFLAPTDPLVTEAATPDFLVVAGADRTVGAAALRVSDFQAAGFEDVSMLLRDDWYRTVIGFRSAAARDEALAALRAQKSDAYARYLPTWCPDAVEKDGVRACEPSKPAQAN